MYEYLFVYIFKSFTFIFINIIHTKGQNKVVFIFYKPYIYKYKIGLSTLFKINIYIYEANKYNSRNDYFTTNSKESHKNSVPEPSVRKLWHAEILKFEN